MASFAKILKRKQKEEISKIIPSNFLIETNKTILKKYLILDFSNKKQEKNINCDDKKLKKQPAQKMINPLNFTHKILKAGFINNLDSLNFNNVYSKLTVTPENSKTKKIRANNIMKEVANKYARLVKQKKFKDQTVFSARLDKQDEDDQVKDKIELYINLKIEKKLNRI